MKRLIKLAVVSLSITSFAHAQPPPTGYIGLYVDTGHTTNEVRNPGGMHELIDKQGGAR